MFLTQRNISYGFSSREPECVVYRSCTVQQLLRDTAITCSSSKAKYQAKSKLKVWSENIKKALTEMKKQYALWVQAGKPRSKQNMTYQRRIKSWPNYFSNFHQFKAFVGLSDYRIVGL
jgi:hypothetical protein